MSNGQRRRSTEGLLDDYYEFSEMERLTSHDEAGPSGSGYNDKHDRVVTNQEIVDGERATSEHEDEDQTVPGSTAHYRLYRRRFFGLAQLVLLNIVAYWAGLTFAAVSATSAEYFHVTQTAINWLSTAYLFAFVVVAPAVIWTLNKRGPKASIVVASLLILVGNWIRYAGARGSVGSRFGVVMFGQILIGLAQPFVLSAPTRYSNLWFSDEGRVTATAVASLANPLGGALGQLIGPLWATKPEEVPNMILYTCALSTLAAVPSFFIPKEPPTPPSAIAAADKLDLREAVHALPKNKSFWFIFWPFSVYVGLFNATAALINQIFEPYGFSETEAGIAGGLLIIVGLIASAIISPIVDKTKRHLLTIKMLVPLIAAAYLALIFMPQTRSLAGPYVICSILGATSFSLLPSVLEYLVLVTHPVSPEITSTICWAGGQLLGAIFIIVEGELKGGIHGEPPGTLKRALIFQAVIACAVVPLPLMLGIGRTKRQAVLPDAR